MGDSAFSRAGSEERLTRGDGEVDGAGDAAEVEAEEARFVITGRFSFP